MVYSTGLSLVASPFSPVAFLLSSVCREVLQGILYCTSWHTCIESVLKKAPRENTVQTLFLSLTSNPVTLTRCSTIGKCPFLAALWSAVSFALVRSNTWPPIMGARYWATPTWPPSADKWKALNPPYIDRHTQHKQCIFWHIKVLNIQFQNEI